MYTGYWADSVGNVIIRAKPASALLTPRSLLHQSSFGKMVWLKSTMPPFCSQVRSHAHRSLQCIEISLLLLFLAQLWLSSPIHSCIAVF